MLLFNRITDKYKSVQWYCPSVYDNVSAHNLAAVPRDGLYLICPLLCWFSAHSLRFAPLMSKIQELFLLQNTYILFILSEMLLFRIFTFLGWKIIHLLKFVVLPVYLFKTITVFSYLQMCQHTLGNTGTSVPTNNKQHYSWSLSAQRYIDKIIGIIKE